MHNFTKFVEAILMANQETTSVARALVETVIVRSEAPLQILADQRSKFEGNLFRKLCKLLSIDKVRTSSYHPRGNGMIGRFHRIFICGAEISYLQQSKKLGRGSAPCPCRLPGVFATNDGFQFKRFYIRS